MKLYKITEFAQLINRTPQTLRKWDKKGVLKPNRKTERGDRFYTEEQLNYFLDKQQIMEVKKRKTIGYCRVSSNKQKDDLDRQITNVKTYMIANGFSFDIISDIGSGINYKIVL